jgi:hypothetical protein
MFRAALLASLTTDIALTPLAARADEPEYAVTVKTAPIARGQTGTLEVAFVAKGPWHWNADFPAKLTLTAPEGLAVTKATLLQKDKDFATKDGKQVAGFELKAASAVTAEGRIVGKVGFCDDKVCITKKIDLPVQLVAK